MNELAYVLLVALRMAALPSTVALDSHVDVDAARMATPVLQEPRVDAWLGEDKFRHFWTSYAVTAFSYAAARATGMESETALTVGMGSAAVAGIGKELYDRKHGTFISVRDFVADALGIGAAYFFLRELH